MSIVSRSTRHRILAAALALVFVAPASAHSYNWFFARMPPNTTVFGNLDVLQSVNGFADGANHKVGVGLKNYANFTETWNYACHPYSAQHYDQPGIRNPHSVEQDPMQGYAYGTNVC
jgi:hypothetical protein